MIGIWSRFLLLACGCLAGYWLASNSVLEDAAEESTTQRSPGTEEPLAKNRFDEPTASTMSCGATRTAIQSTQHLDTAQQPSISELPETGLPPKYQKMVEPKPPEPESFAEWYLAFLNEARDDAWAVPVEARIGELIAASGVQGIQAEYVSCRSSRCTVAGYADPTAGFDSCSVSSWIGKARIFDRTFGSTCRDEEIGGLQRFVVLIDSERPL